MLSRNLFVISCELKVVLIDEVSVIVLFWELIIDKCVVLFFFDVVLGLSEISFFGVLCIVVWVIICFMFNCLVCVVRYLEEMSFLRGVDIKVGLFK